MDNAEALKKIIDDDKRYKLEAYIFVLEALFYSRKKFKKEGHITGPQLLEGIRDLALQRFGPLAKMVFEHWGIKMTVDFGNIVFNMVNTKILGKTDEDRIEDFEGIYDFDQTFVQNYKPVFSQFKK